LKEKKITSKKLQNYEERKEPGLISEKEFLEQEISYLETEKNYLENLKEFHLQRIELKKIWGILTEVD